MKTEKTKPFNNLQIVRSNKRYIVVKVSRRRSTDPAQPHRDDQTKTPQSAEVFRLPISSIQILGHAYDSRHIDNLAQSMRVVGQQTPISVYHSDGSEGVLPRLFVLIDGHHQLEAAKANGRSEIDCILVQGNLSDLRRRHIEDRLFQARLNKLIRSESIALWVRLTDRISGQHVQKSGPGRPSGGLAKAARSLTVLGKSEEARRKAVERAIQIDQISAEAKTTAINAGFADNQRALLEIAKQPTPEAQLLKVAELSAAKRARPKQDSSAPVSGIDGEAPVPGSPASTPPADSPNTRKKPNEDERCPAPVGGIDGEVPVAGSPASTPVDPPNAGPEPDGGGLMAAWQNAEPFRRAWGNAPMAIRNKFFSEVMQDYRE
jgi:ParB-like nuclease domain